MPRYELRLLGPPELLRKGRAVPLRSRKTWYLLGYLALEGETRRETLAGLLWASESGRANLRAELYRLEQRAPGLVVRKGPRVALADAAVDVLRFLELAESGRPEQALEYWRGPLLEGLEAGLTPELEDWLEYRRTRLRERRERLLVELAEQTLEPERAVALLEDVLEDDPLNEDALRRLMRRQAELGRKAEALRAYHRFVAFLERELGLPPEPETRELARAVREGRTPPLKAPGHRFAGRTRELSLMQRAFEEGRSVFLHGEPGIGKTRLLYEFVAGLGRRPLILKARPGDPAVPYASLARGVRELLQLGAQPPEWAAMELARIVPELGAYPTGTTPARFVAAVAELLRPFLEGEWVLGVDDLQYLDSASAHLLIQLAGELSLAPYLAAYREGTLPPHLAAWVHEEIASGRSTALELPPLDAQATRELLGVDPDRAAELAERAGGNPFFLLLLAQGPADERPRKVLRARLAAASPLARRIAELASVAGEAYRLELAIEILETSPLAAAEASDELERLGLFRRGTIAHDLVLETIREVTKPDSLAYWHARLARALEGRAPAAVLAAHLAAAGDRAAAALRWREAGLEAERAFAYREALAFFARALEHAPPEMRESLETSTFIPRYRIHLALADWEGARRLLARARAFARERGLPWLRDRAELGQADLDFRQGRFEAALERTTVLIAAGNLDAEGQAHAHYLRAISLQALGREEETVEACRRALELASPGWEMEAWVHNTLAIAEMRLGRTEEARRRNARALARFRQEGNPVGEANAIRVMAELASLEGNVAEADRLFEEALALARRTGHRIILSFVLAAALRHHEALGRKRRVRELAREGVKLPGPYRTLFRRHR